MSENRSRRSIDLGAVQPARSRHAGRRSAVAFVDDHVVAGTAAGRVLASDSTTLEKQWVADFGGDRTSVVAIQDVAGDVVVGERSPTGTIRVYDGDTGTRCWAYDTVADVGSPQQESRFFLPFVVDVETDDERIYAASRRYERDGERRSFTSIVYAFDYEGDLVWTYRADASPISLDVADDRVAVAYNRCPGSHQRGLVVLNVQTGEVRYDWDPGTEGQRRVGDVSLLSDGVTVASHGDYRGYRLRDGGDVAWTIDLATPIDAAGESLYAYPNHVHASSGSIVFLTGNTYAEGGRETASLHPDEHTAFCVTPEGERRWTESIGGFANEIDADGGTLAVPSAQHFRSRDPTVHGLRIFDGSGEANVFETEGIVTTAALDRDRIAAIEEPVVYHDEGERRGEYRLFARSV